jgi:hypothetical protein
MRSDADENAERIHVVYKIDAYTLCCILIDYIESWWISLLFCDVREQSSGVLRD